MKFYDNGKLMKTKKKVESLEAIFGDTTVQGTALAWGRSTSGRASSSPTSNIHTHEWTAAFILGQREPYSLSCIGCGRTQRCSNEPREVRRNSFSGSTVYEIYGLRYTVSDNSMLSGVSDDAHRHARDRALDSLGVRREVLR